jgi:hypothetical protein
VGLRAPGRGIERRLCMEDDYYSIDSILSENQVLVLFSAETCLYVLPTFTQKIRCTFKVDIPDVGHLDGGHERDVRVENSLSSHTTPNVCVRSKLRAKFSCHSGLPSSLYTRA